MTVETPTVPKPMVDIPLPRVMQFLLRPKRYKVPYGGRGGTKSWSIARALLLLAAKPEKLFSDRTKLRILCTRETQTSITESVHRLLCDQIDALGLSKIFDIQQKVIRCPRVGSEFVFMGIRTDPGKIKGLEGVDICWVEEAEKVSEQSWKFLIPTIRKAGSEIWVSFNPDEEDDPTSKRFLAHPPPDSIVKKVGWENNKWFPETLRKEKDYDYRVDPEAAEHTWGGAFRKASQAQIFGPITLPDGTRKPKYIVEDFVAEEKNKAGELQPKAGWTGPYFGADWGFSNDPTTLVKMWMFQRTLYIEHEAYAIGCELNQIPELFDSVPGSRKHVIRADCARPETIFHVSSLGFNVVGAEKWDGSVQDGITWLRGLIQIVINPRCKKTIQEFRLYRFKVDKLTGDVLPIIVDAHNHIIDGIRYGMGPAIRTEEEEIDAVFEEPVSISGEIDEFDQQANW